MNRRAPRRNGRTQGKRPANEGLFAWPGVRRRYRYAPRDFGLLPWRRRFAVSPLGRRLTRSGAWRLLLQLTATLLQAILPQPSPADLRRAKDKLRRPLHELPRRRRKYQRMARLFQRFCARDAASRSFNPRSIVLRARPVMFETAARPPHPAARTSLAANSRRPRCSSCFEPSASHRCRIECVPIIHRL